MTCEQTVNLKPPEFFVLKLYIGNRGKEYHRKETEGFETLMSWNMPQGIIGYFGSYSKNDQSYILLEHADLGTLEDYFRERHPPVSDSHIIDFYSSLFKFISGLCHIHTLPSNKNGGQQAGVEDDPYHVRG
jgi:serine/threonine protein kinase